MIGPGSKVQIRDVDKSGKKDPNDCHRLPCLDAWIGQRSVIVTTKGTVKGRLEYAGGWYYCCAPFHLIDDRWMPSLYRFMFRKGQFKSIEFAPVENSRGR